MQITLMSQYCFKIKIKKTILLIANSLEKVKKIPADIVVIVSDLIREPRLKEKKERPFVVTATGEYEISGISVFNQEEFLLIEAEGIRLGLLKQAETELTEAQLEEVDGIDFLLVGFSQEEEKLTKAIKIINQIQPRLVVLNKNKVVTKFLKELRQEEAKQTDKLTVSKADLPEEMEAVVLLEKNGGQ